MKFFKRLYWVINGTILGIILVIFGSNMWIINTTKDRVTDSSSDLPDGYTALVLGTSKSMSDGGPNPYFQYRMEAVARLYKTGKVRHFILSGDNRSKYYNEPRDMQLALIKLGVPANATTLDYAGLRTLDSVVRCKEVFNKNEIIVVTQKFHAYRALYICQFYKLDAYAYTAENITVDRSLKVLFREMLARPKAILDLYFTKTEPKHISFSGNN